MEDWEDRRLLGVNAVGGQGMITELGVIGDWIRGWRVHGAPLGASPGQGGLVWEDEQEMAPGHSPIYSLSGLCRSSSSFAQAW